MIDIKTHENILILAEKWASGTITEAERLEFDLWYEQQDNLFEIHTPETRTEMANRLYQSILAKGNIRRKNTIRLWQKIAVAATMAMVISGIYFFRGERAVQHNGQVQLVNDVPPGKNAATLTLASGQRIELSGQKTGLVIEKLKLAYNDHTELPQAGQLREILSAKAQKLTAATPRGGTYQLVLADGTRVWLNADSRLEFPSDFRGAEYRTVSLIGEAYFEVVHDPKQPFRVESKGQMVEDIGTAFNIAAYPDEQTVKTTLVEGSASVNAVLLKPNQQSILTRQSAIKVIAIDVTEVTDWKDHLFVFNEEDIHSVMKRLSRWYNITVEYQGNSKDVTFVGQISTSRNLSEVLQLMERSGKVSFRVQGRKVTVISK